jgi:hypothetical protein
MAPRGDAHFLTATGIDLHIIHTLNYPCMLAARPLDKAISVFANPGMQLHLI